MMGYDRFSTTYQQHVLVTDLASQVGHKAGQSVEVNWSGRTMALTDPVTGRQTKVFLFVGVCRPRAMRLVELAADTTQDAWLRAHVSTFCWFGGSAADCSGQPQEGRDRAPSWGWGHPQTMRIREFASHYCAAVLPGRVRKPKDGTSAQEHDRQHRHSGHRRVKR